MAEMTDITTQALQVQVDAFIESWQQEKAERTGLASDMATDGNRAYQQGYADALDRCVQALKMLRG